MNEYDGSDARSIVFDNIQLTGCIIAKLDYRSAHAMGRVSRRLRMAVAAMDVYRFTEDVQKQLIKRTALYFPDGAYTEKMLDFMYHDCPNITKSSLPRNVSFVNNIKYMKKVIAFDAEYVLVMVNVDGPGNFEAFKLIVDSVVALNGQEQRNRFRTSTAIYASGILYGAPNFHYKKPRYVNYIVGKGILRDYEELYALYASGTITLTQVVGQMQIPKTREILEYIRDNGFYDLFNEIILQKKIETRIVFDTLEEMFSGAYY